MLTQPLLTKRFDQINPLSISDYLDHQGYDALKKAVSMTRESIIEEIKLSRIRGRGGAGFPAGLKLESLTQEQRVPKIIICNADEGEPGNFKDRFLMEKDPHQIIEGMIIAAYATEATEGFIYLRGEYQNAMKIMQTAIDEAHKHGYLGRNIMNREFDFSIEIRSGAGSYVCGEEFALIESLEGKAGRTRVKPPFPTAKGYMGLPTLINNVETFANFPHIIDMGGETYAKIGTESSTGTKLISLSGNIKHKNVFEVPFGVSIRKVIQELGGGVFPGKKIKMVQLGGACGPFIPEYMLDMMIDFDRFEEFESKTGAGAIIVIDERQDMFDLLLNISEFFAHESCGKCTPCREGNIQLTKTLKKFVDFNASFSDLNSLESQARVMHQTALCGLGQTATTAIISTLHYFRFVYIQRIEASTERKEEQ